MNVLCQFLSTFSLIINHRILNMPSVWTGTGFDAALKRPFFEIETITIPLVNGNLMHLHDSDTEFAKENRIAIENALNTVTLRLHCCIPLLELTATSRIFRQN